MLTQLTAVRPLYIDRRVRPTFPVSKCQNSPNRFPAHHDDKEKSQEQQLPQITPYNLNHLTIQWHIRNTFIMKENLKRMLIAYFIRKNLLIKELRQKNSNKQEQRISILKSTIAEMLNNRKKIYQLLRHQCPKHAQIQEKDEEKENIKKGQNVGMVNFDCNDCLGIFTKYFINLGQEDANANTDEIIQELFQGNDQQKDEGEKKYRTSILIPNKKSSRTSQANNSKKLDNVTILDSLLDIELYNTYTRKKIETYKTVKQIERKSNNQLAEAQPNKQNKLLKKKSIFNLEQKQISKKKSQCSPNLLNSILQKSLGRMSGADRFYSVIKQALKTKGNFSINRQNTENSKLTSEESEHLKPIQSIRQDQRNRQTSEKPQSQVALLSKQQQSNLRIEYLRKNAKVKSRQGHTQRSKNEKLKSNAEYTKYQNEISKEKKDKKSILKQPSRDRMKIKTDLGKYSPFRKDEKKSNGNKKNVTIKKKNQEVLVHDQNQENKRNRSRRPSKGHTGKNIKLDKSISGRERMQSLRRIRRRPAFLKKNKKKSIELAFKSIESSTSNEKIEIKSEKSCQHVSFAKTHSVGNKLTKYEAARQNFRAKYYLDELNAINNSEISPQNSLNPFLPKKRYSKSRGKRPSINCLIPHDSNQNTLMRRPSLRSKMSVLELDELKNEKMQHFYHTFNYIEKSRKKNSSSSQLLQNLETSVMNKEEFDLKETKQIIKIYLKRYQQNPKIFELLKFFTYLEQNLQKQLEEKLKYQDPYSMALQSDIERVEMDNFLQNLSVEPIDDYQQCKFEETKNNGENFRKYQYEQRFITKLNNGVFDLLAWNEDFNKMELDQELLDQVSLKEIHEIKI